jgi:hypothetical protein
MCIKQVFVSESHVEEHIMCKKPCHLVILVGLAWLLPVSNTPTPQLLKHCHIFNYQIHILEILS